MSRHPHAAHTKRKGYRPKPWQLGALCAVVLTAATIGKAAAAVLAEYAVLLFCIAVALIGRVAPVNPPPGWSVVGNQLQSAVQSAETANSTGNTRQELSNLSKAIGLADALMGMTASCDACGELRTDLQAIIGLASKLRARLLTGGACNPNGVIGPGESCDPLADPTGCPNIIPTFCDDQCFCEAIPTSTTTTTTATATTTTTIACPAGETACAGMCV